MKSVSGKPIANLLPDDIQIDILTNCIEYFNNIITKEEARFIIDYAEKANQDPLHPWKFQDARVGNEKKHDVNLRSNKLMPLMPPQHSIHNLLNVCKDKYPEVLKIVEILSDALIACVRYYSEKYEVPIAMDEGFTLLKYQTGEEYKPHTDCGPSKPMCDRTISIVGYLNPGEYSGGETYFNNFNVSVNPNKTGLVLFPSNYAYIHHAMPVMSGTKYSIVTWMMMPQK